MNEHTTTLPAPRRWHRLGLLGASLAMAAPLWAQPITEPAPAATAAAAVAEPPADPAPAAPMALPVGQATRSLLQRQRESTGADTGTRPLDGAMADSAYQRYLKSFDQPLPAWFGQQVKTPVN